MATVTGLTAEKADEIHDESLVSGVIDPATGRLLFTTMGGAVQDAGLVRGSVALRWDRAWTYQGGDLVFYAGRAYRAAITNTNKVPAFDSTAWVLISGASSNELVELDPTFERSSYSDQWETFWKTGSPTPSVNYTTTAGEFETGRRALKVFLPPSSSQRIYQKEENLVRGGDVIVFRVRAKKLSASTGLKLNANLMQNAEGPPEPLNPTATFVTADVVDVVPTTSWATYEFRFVAINAKPRAIVSLQVEQDGTGTSDVVIDWIKVSRGSPDDPAPNTGWIAATLSAGYTAGTVHYRRKNGQLYIRINDLLVSGGISVGADGNFTDKTLFILPSGFRPGEAAVSMDHVFEVKAGSVIMVVSIYPSGTVSFSHADSRNVAYTIAATTEIQGGSPGFLINS